MNKRPVLHLICGLPGSGKSTFAKQLEQELDALRLAPDEWLHWLGIDFYNETGRARIEKLQWKLAQQLLQHGNDVILENGFWSKQERDSYRTVAAGVGAVTKIHFLDVPVPELKARLIRRNKTRHANTPEVNPSRLDEWANVFEPPTDEELRD